MQRESFPCPQWGYLLFLPILFSFSPQLFFSYGMLYNVFSFSPGHLTGHCLCKQSHWAITSTWYHVPPDSNLATHCEFLAFRVKSKTNRDEHYQQQSSFSIFAWLLSKQPSAPPLPSSGQRPLVFPLCTVNSFIVQTTRSQPWYELNWKECADCRKKKKKRTREMMEVGVYSLNPK